jgi:Do/DeqQ family serine protease
MWRRLWLVFAQAVTVAVAALFVVLTFKPQWLGGGGVAAILPAPTIREAVPAAGAASASTGLAYAARRAAPAVASIAATRMARNPHADDPRFRWFGQPGGGSGQAQRQQLGLGSAVVVSPEGYVLTNHHVIDGAVDIELVLPDGRSTRAKFVGSDPETDIALLKIELPDLPVVAFGQSQALQVGDAVLAIGNPFNIGQTVTAGIVSALDRNRFQASRFQNFIQTDAAINPGNSGGALVDANGSLVGINTAIFSRTGGNLGIGFAVPVEIARHVMEQLIKEGKVRRGWLGVQPSDISPEMAQALSLPTRQGVLITGVLRGGPAAEAGLKPGDVLVRIAEREVANVGELFGVIGTVAPGTQLPVEVLRGGQKVAASVTFAERPGAEATVAPGDR